MTDEWLALDAGPGYVRFMGMFGRLFAWLFRNQFWNSLPWPAPKTGDGEDFPMMNDD